MHSISRSLYSLKQMKTDDISGGHNSNFIMSSSHIFSRRNHTALLYEAVMQLLDYTHCPLHRRHVSDTVTALLRESFVLTVIVLAV